MVRNLRNAPQSTLSSLLIWSPDHTGHHFLYAKLVAQFSIEKGIPVTVYVSNAGRDSVEFALHLGCMDLSVAPADSFHRAVGLMPSNALMVICHADRILFQLLLAAVPKSARVSALIMRPPRTVDGNFKPFMKSALIHSINYRANIRVSELAALGDRPSRSTAQVPDPVVRSGEPMAVDAARSLLGLPSSGDCILGVVVGLLSLRKRPDLLVRALALLPEDHHILFAGHQRDRKSVV